MSGAYMYSATRHQIKKRKNVEDDKFTQAKIFFILKRI